MQEHTLIVMSVGKNKNERGNARDTWKVNMKSKTWFCLWMISELKRSELSYKKRTQCIKMNKLVRSGHSSYPFLKST